MTRFSSPNLLLFMAIILVAQSSSAVAALTVQQAPTSKTSAAGALDLIRRQKYNEAITLLEEMVELHPANGEVLTYLATAHLYQDLNFTKAQREFETAFKSGGGATFFVTHSHEKLSADDFVDYCRGWLHLRADGVEFAPSEGSHGFKLKYAEIEEFKLNRFSKIAFHIKVNGKNQNFRGRSASDLEPLLVLALYKSFARPAG